ncbi:hypothetical protein PH210_05405 [Paenibacillus sp. BSR1-1]|uniref:hypothetical protein n=1 Tax=Paenibacillus sp. BSR1-1 TaxID=3020845 RepID=UPI0025AFF373|nr:hypothetical protein [Paenibacillus sp. BSR1-1]MDN3015645.1 hypothetical protein [Paenibacillus sp. BSR1-1]
MKEEFIYWEGTAINAYVLGFQEIDHTTLMAVGGKGLNLGELSRIEGILVSLWILHGP